MGIWHLAKGDSPSSLSKRQCGLLEALVAAKRNDRHGTPLSSQIMGDQSGLGPNPTEPPILCEGDPAHHFSTLLDLQDTAWCDQA